MVKYFKFTLPFYIVIFMGCASNTSFYEKAAVSKAGFSSGRQIVRTASLSLSVESLDEKVEEFSILTEKYDGYIEESNRYSKKRAGVKAKVPSENLELFLHDVAALGRVTNSSTSSKDVTEQVIDIDRA